MDTAEFLRRWESMPGLKHAELIDGVVFCMPSPISRLHGLPAGRISTWLGNYADSTPGCEYGPEMTWVMGERNTPQPDLYLRILPEHGGQSGDNGVYCTGAPELIVEVSISSLSRDLSAKLRLYESAGVQEYVSVLPQGKRIEWRRLIRGSYKKLDGDADGIFRSRVFPGLWLDPTAVWQRGPGLTRILNDGLQSKEHATFVKRLAAAGRAKR